MANLFFTSFINTMQVQNFNLCNNSYNQNLYFQGGRAKPLNLFTALRKHKDILPFRIQQEAQNSIKFEHGNIPTLKELHQKTYALLNECKTLEEVKSIYPEFSCVKDAINAFGHARGNIKTLKEQGQLNKSLSLKILRDYWYNLKSQEEIAKDLGLTNRSALTYIFDRLHIPTFGKNYKTLILSSDPETHALIAAKTTAWNAAHPDLMIAHNRMAGQANKTPSRREASSVRMKEYIKEHPEFTEKMSEYDRAVWAELDDVKIKLRDFISKQNGNVRVVMAKSHNNEPLNAKEQITRRILYKKFWETHPECLEQLRQAHKEVSAYWKAK